MTDRNRAGRLRHWFYENLALARQIGPSEALCLAAAALIVLPVGLISSGGLTPEEERGRQIFLHGTSPTGKEIVAVLDGGATRVNASAFPCMSCHGADGKGKSEGGVVAPDITWTTLTKPYVVSRSDGRSRPPYTEASFKRAITMGLDPSGKALDAVMPRFQLAYQDAADLTAFLKKLNQLSDPGLSEDSIRIGVVLPQRQRLPIMHAAVQKALSAYFDKINQGGIYGRRIELVFTDLPSADAEGAAAFQQWLARESIFALTGSFLGNAEKSLPPVLDRAGIPLIAAFTLNPDSDAPLNRYVFYLDAGLRGEVDELIALAQKQFPAGARAAVVLAPYDLTRRLNENVKNVLHSANWSVDEIREYADGCRSAESIPAPQVIFWVVPQFSPAALEGCSAGLGHKAEFLLPGSFTTKEMLGLSTAWDHRVFLTIPKATVTGVPDAWPSRDNGGAAAVASARLLVEALQQAGHDVTRQKLVEVMENFYQLDLGFGFTVTFGPNRRVGGTAQELVTLDLRKRRLVPVEIGASTK